MEATLISISRPSDVYRTPSARSVKSLLRRFTIAITLAPLALTNSTVLLVSVVVPDWLMATTSVSDMSDDKSNAESSVAGLALTFIPVSISRFEIAFATAFPATAAVPCPITTIFFVFPDFKSSFNSSERVSLPNLTVNFPLSKSLTKRPLRVDLTEEGDSSISFNK